MSEIQPPSLDVSLPCDLCGHSYSASQVALRGKLNFCQACATGCPAECLQRLQGKTQGKPGKSRWPAVAASLFAFGLLATVAWTVSKTLPVRDLLSSYEPVGTVEGAPPAPPSAPNVATPGSSPATADSKETATPWLQRLFTDRSRRSVEDAGHIHLLFVIRPGTDARMGLASLVFATREAPNENSAKLTTEVGPQMATSFDEGLRYVRKQPRDWEREFSIRLSFEDKFTSKDGGSAGTGFTITMLAAIQGIALDPTVAVTGDLTVDGTVQPVGAVVEKLRGAIDEKCQITLIPERNSRDAVDLALLDGTSPLWETQIFTIGTIDQALGLARKDRAENIKNALARFSALRARLPPVVTPNYLQSPIVQAELKEVLLLAPNHLSAATLLRAAENRLPHELSLNRSVEEIVATSYLFVSDVINPAESKPGPSGNNNGIAIFPDREFSECLKSLQRLTPILDRRSLELKSCCIAYAGAIRSALTYKSPDAYALRTRQQMAEVVRRETQFVQQDRDNMDQARSRLLLAVRKLDTDGSLVSDLKKK